MSVLTISHYLKKMIEYEQQLGIRLEITENLKMLMSDSNKISFLFCTHG
jgi:hypothetical protein